MDTTMFFVIFNTFPNTVQAAEVVSGALAHVWVLDSSPDNALKRAQEYVERHGFQIKSVQEPLMATTEESFVGEKLAIKSYRRAQKDGIYAFFVGYEKPDPRIVN